VARRGALLALAGAATLPALVSPGFDPALREDAHLAQRCGICGKGTLSGHSVSHANNATKRKWNPNLQRVRALRDGRVQNIDVCTRCLRSGRVEKAVRRRRQLTA
jgi:large subunit ribosomal protein L28